jgi:Mce-associated membrane protein
LDPRTVSSAGIRAWLGGPLRTATFAVGVLAVVAFAAVGWFGLSWYRAAHDEPLVLGMARDAVLQDAQQATINLNTLDYRRVQEGLALWEQSATGSVLDDVRANRDTYARAITEAKTTTTASVPGSAVAEFNERAGTARVLVGVDVTSQREQGDASCVRRRMQLEMRRDGTAWKVDRLVPVGAANPVPGACSAVRTMTPK